MGTITVVVPNETEQQFRQAAREQFGYSEEALSEAVGTALQTWTEQVRATAKYRKEAEALGDPIVAISGLLRHIKKSSVELQHEIGTILSEKYDRHRC